MSRVFGHFLSLKMSFALKKNIIIFAYIPPNIPPKSIHF
jgi:hypothetical protein